MHSAFDVIQSLIDFEVYETSEKYGDAKPYSSTSLEVLFDYIRWYYTHTPVKVSGDATDRVYTVYEGVRSGGVSTNLLDTIISDLICRYIHKDCESLLAIRPTETTHIINALDVKLNSRFAHSLILV